MRLQLKVLLILIPVMLAPVIGIAMLAIFHLRDQARIDYLDQVQIVLDQIAFSEHLRSQRANDTALLLSEHWMIREVLNRKLAGGETNSDDTRLMRLLGSFRQAVPAITEISLFSTDGLEILRSANQIAGMEPSSSWGEIAFANLSLRADGTNFELTQDPNNGELALVKALPIFLDRFTEGRPDPEKTIGAYILLTRNLEHIHRQLLKAPQGRLDDYLLINSERSIILSSSPQTRALEPALLPLIPANTSVLETDITQANESEDYIALSQKLASGLILVGAISKQEILSRSKILEQRTLAILFISALLSIVAVYSGIRILILDKLKILRSEIQKTARGGKTRPSIDIVGQDEISDLTRNFLDLNEKLGSSRHALLLMKYRNATTNLANETGLKDNIALSIHSAQLNQQFSALIILDLDDFGLINDGLGSAAGTQLLGDVASRLRTWSNGLQAVESGGQDAGYRQEWIGHFGEDEFCILLRTLDTPESAALVSEDLMRLLDSDFSLNGNTITISASIGIAIAPQDASSASEMIKCARTALSEAKRKGKGRYQFFDPALGDDASQRLSLQSEFGHALSNGEFHLHYQPRVSLRGEKKMSFEALVRWQNPSRGMISPGKFIPIAENTGFIVKLGDWILDDACRQIREWLDQGHQNLLVSVNLSPVQVNRTDPLQSILSALEKWKIPAHTLEVEITESGLMQDEEQTIALLKRIREAGVRIALDDFGTGYSSLSYLRTLPIDTLKIDRSFIAHLEDQPDSIEVLHCITDLARRLDLEIICEGVENHQQLRIVQTLGCDIVQGYVYSKPQPAEDAMAFYRKLYARHSTLNEA